ncbi:MAG TPA: NHL repeat-containing protein [Abditibacteriaceae bacterium]|nr:NHL repeat-containing protein [Abditibacteriaceae bacterium]
MPRLGYLFLLLLLSGCVRHMPAPPVEIPASLQVWGKHGAGPGEFIRPRAIALAPTGFAYIADTSGRIQKWTQEGKFVKAWSTPNVLPGRIEGIEGIALLPDGNIACTDTHASKILIYTPDGKLVRSFGQYGKGRGQFLLVTGICVDAAGSIYAADYGGTFDRISKWTQQGKLLASWSGHGEGPRQFRRPFGLAMSREGDLLVVDSCNHRIQRLDPTTGVLKGIIGTFGSRDGQLNYPYGIAVDRAGDIYTSEYNTHRVQKWSPDGKFLARWGEAGRAVGQLANPWGVAVDKDENIYVTDTENHRIQKFRF